MIREPFEYLKDLGYTAFILMRTGSSLQSIPRFKTNPNHSGEKIAMPKQSNASKRSPIRPLVFIGAIAALTYASAWWGNQVRNDMVQIIEERGLPINNPGQ